MNYSIRINMNNEAFSDSNNTTEIARLLRELASKIERGGELYIGDAENLRDINGNMVGRAAVTR